MNVSKKHFSKLLTPLLQPAFATRLFENLQKNLSAAHKILQNVSTLAGKSREFLMWAAALVKDGSGLSKHAATSLVRLRRLHPTQSSWHLWAPPSLTSDMPFPTIKVV